MVKPLHSGIDKVYRMANLAKASAKVCANKGAAGIDKVNVEIWQAKEAAHLRQLHGELYSDKYRSQPVRRVYTYPNLAQTSKGHLEYPHWPAGCVAGSALSTAAEIFFEGSHGFRPGRSTHTAKEAILKHKKAGYRYVVDLD